MEIIIRNCENRFFSARGALRNSDLRFLREEFEGDIHRVCIAVQGYVEAFTESELADKQLRDYMASIGDTGCASWDHENKTVKRFIPTQEQKEIKDQFGKARELAGAEAAARKNDLLVLMYGVRGARDYDYDAWGYVREDSEDGYDSEDGDEDGDE